MITTAPATTITAITVSRITTTTVSTSIVAIFIAASSYARLPLLSRSLGRAVCKAYDRHRAFNGKTLSVKFEAFNLVQCLSRQVAFPTV